jgi:diguanylate cyclase (GGDEF)-like protein/PAS domain S-box-containing protein
MSEPISSKITLLNQATLESFNLDEIIDVVKNFTDTSIKILDADFGFAWWKVQNEGVYKLAYKTSTTPYAPNLPREKGGNQEALKTKSPFFVDFVVKENYEPEYDVSEYMESYVIIPIFYKKDMYGSLVLCYKKQHLFLDEEKSFCNIIGNTMAQAITIHKLVKSEQIARQIAENQESRFRALIENSYDVIVLLDSNGHVIDISNSIIKLSGYSVGEMLGRPLRDFIYNDDIQIVFDHLQKVLATPRDPISVQFRYCHKNGDHRWMEAVGVNLLADSSVESIVVNIRDITERKKNQETIEHQAMHDSLTGLPNRQSFIPQFEQALAVAKRQDHQVALMFLDMDRFKNINDRLGHSAGDTLLKVVASRIKSCLREEDFTARFGGDEFLILVNEVNDPKNVVTVAEKILKAVAVPLKIGDHTVHPTVSIGIALFPGDGQEMETLKKNSDAALYKSKEKGKNRFSFYDHAMDGMQTTEKLAFENELRESIALNQIELYYQPIISLKSGNLIAVEALVRWNHPHKGFILPSEFISMAEESGIIIALGEHVMRLACSHYELWKKTTEVNFKMSVNVSPISFCESNFIAGVSQILEDTNMDPHKLEVEITETAAMVDLELTSCNLKALKKMDVGISIDDFGTGYSSLSYLKRFPINNLKIDKSFIHACITSPQDTSITKTIIAMAKTLNLKVIAEGVETKQQLDFLKFLNCDAAQGYLISEPMPANELLGWIKKTQNKN